MFFVGFATIQVLAGSTRFFRSCPRTVFAGASWILFDDFHRAVAFGILRGGLAAYAACA